MTLSTADLREYLIGQPGEAARQRIEDVFFADRSAFDAMVDEMDAICDAFLRDGLDTREHARVVELAAGGLWAERMSFARALRQAASRSSAGNSGAHAGTARTGESARVISFVDWVRARDWKAQLRAAAVLLVVALGWPLYWLQTRAQRADLASARARATQQVAEAQTQAQAARRALDSANVRSAQLELAAQKQVTAAFALTPTFTRGGGSPLQISTRAALVRFELALEDGTPPGPYAATITSASGATVFSATDIVATAGVPVLVLPAQSLPGGDYRLTLRRSRDAAGAAAVAEFGFTVRR